MANSERNTDVVLTCQDPNLVVGRQVVHDQRAIDRNREMPQREFSHHNVHGHFDLNQQRYVPRVLVFHEGLLKTRPELTLSTHQNLHHGGVLVPLVKVREIPSAKRGVLIRDGHSIFAAIDETNILIRIFGLHCNQELGEEAEIRLKVESLNGHAFHMVGRHLRLVEGVEIEDECRYDEDEEEQEAIAATYASEATTPAFLVMGRLVTGDIAAVGRGTEASVVLR